MSFQLETSSFTPYTCHRDVNYHCEEAVSLSLFIKHVVVYYWQISWAPGEKKKKGKKALVSFRSELFLLKMENEKECYQYLS